MIVAATGHRPDKLGGYTPTAHVRLMTVAADYLSGLAERPECVISGMALGWDQAFASAAVVLQIPFIAAVPFESQASKWPAESRNRYNALLAKAKAWTVICEGGYANRKFQIRNEWMVNHCDRVCALWDGTDGGTANCVRYAESVGKPVDNLHAEWKHYCAEMDGR